MYIEYITKDNYIKMSNYFKGFIAEIFAVTLGVISLQEINQYLEFALLVSGLVSSLYGLHKFLRVKK